MQKMLGLLAGVCFSALTASAALADQGERWPRWYVGLSGDVAFIKDSDVKTGAPASSDVSFDDGGRANIALGYSPVFPGNYFSNIRVEAELGYMWNSVNTFTLGGVPNSADDLRTLTYMGNLYYDFRNPSQFTPYIGAGAGGARVKLEQNNGVGSDDSDNVFAYQFMAGLTFAPTSIPLTEWGIGYRYFVADNPKFNSGTVPYKLDDITAHNVEISARFRF